MTEYHIKNFRLSDFEVDTLKSPAKNTTGVILRLSSGTMATHKDNFRHNLLLTDRLVFARFSLIFHQRI